MPAFSICFKQFVILHTYPDTFFNTGIVFQSTTWVWKWRFKFQNYSIIFVLYQEEAHQFASTPWWLWPEWDKVHQHLDVVYQVWKKDFKTKWHFFTEITLKIFIIEHPEHNNNINSWKEIKISFYNSLGLNLLWRLWDTNLSNIQTNAQISQPCLFSME